MFSQSNNDDLTSRQSFSKEPRQRRSLLHDGIVIKGDWQSDGTVEFGGRITGDLTVSDSVTINDILYPNKGLNIDNDFIVDIETKITTINNDLTVNSDTVLNTLVVNDFCKPNLGININEGDCTIGVGGYSVFGQTGDTFSTNKNNPLIICPCF